MQKIPLTREGYVDVGELLSHAPPFLWLCGGRGTGKTFGALADVRYNNPRKFLLLRRTQQQIDLIRKPAFNPFKAVDAVYKGSTAVVTEGKVAIFYEGELIDGEIKPTGSPIGYAAALSTIHNVRGVDLADVEVIIYDEFIPEPHERPIKEEYTALLNALETIGRNRELQGREPLRLVALSNSNMLGNPYFVGMGVIRVVDKMIKDRRELWTDAKRGLMIGLLWGSPVSEAKAGTALYKLAGGSAFASMSLGNEFVGDVCTRQGTAPLQELRPLARVGELVFYEHKSTREVYVLDHVSGSPPYYAPDDTGLRRARRDLWEFWTLYLDNQLYFQDVLCEILFKKYFAG